MRTWYRNLDYGALLLWIVLVTIGLVAIYSATHGRAEEFLLETVQQSFERQLLWLGICSVGLVIALLFPARWYQQISYPLYAASLLLLVAALLFGREVGGAKSWLYFGPIGIQSSEMAKVGVVLAVSQLIASRREMALTAGQVLATIALIALPAGIVVMQNDAGTALVYAGLIPVYLFWGGIPLNILLLVASPAIAGYLSIISPPAAVVFAIAVSLWLYWRSRYVTMLVLGAVLNGGVIAGARFALERLLQPHQVARIMSFANPEAEEFRQGVGFHLVQSKAAIGAGGLFGQGFMQGTQTQGRYIPEQSTDFIFSVIGEEWGFVGAILVIGLLSLFILRIIRMGAQIRHPFGAMIAAGAAGAYMIHVFINVGMVLGLLPVIGIPLPFLSYGGSALLTNTAMLAIVLALYMRRDDFSVYAYPRSRLQGGDYGFKGA